MARTSRKNQAPNGIEILVKEKHHVGLYVRLSVFNNGYHTNDSIENQIELLKQYIESHLEEMELTQIYIDNGATGTNFDRSAWNQLITDMKSGEINCVIVKDFSRFGRNYIEVGNYIEKIFPFLGVRVIAVNENFDSKIHQFKEEMFMSSLTNIVNEYYARDISQKVIQTKRAKHKCGKFNGCVPPYGYLKDTEDREKLVVDSETADIVKKIFEWRLQEKGCLKIARYLNELLVPSPGLYRYRQGYAFFKKCENSKWQSKHVVSILGNPIYLGNMVQGKTRTSYFVQDGKVKYLPKEEWIVVENTHEPIVTQRQFDIAEQMALASKEKHHQQMNANSHIPKVENPFAKKMFCGQCGILLTRRSRVHKGIREYTFNCTSVSRKLNGHCKNTYIYEAEVVHAIQKGLEMQFRIIGSIQNQWKRNKVVSFDMDTSQKRKQKQYYLENKIEMLKNQKLEMYTDVRDGLLSMEEYSYVKQQTDNEIIKASSDLESVKDVNKRMTEIEQGVNDYQEIVFSLMDKEISYKLIDQLVEKIVVIAPDRIEVTFSFADKVANLLQMLPKECD